MAKRGETREIILKAATKLFFENGFEKTSVKMILNESNVVTGSFYHFFPSKEALFEAVVEEFLKDYSLKVRTILEDDTLETEQIIEAFFDVFFKSTDTYFKVLQADKLHWTVKCALHDMTIEALVEPMTHALSRLLKNGSVKSILDLEAETLARIMIKGSEAVIHSQKTEEKAVYRYEDLCDNLIKFWKQIISFSLSEDFPVHQALSS